MPVRVVSRSRTGHDGAPAAGFVDDTPLRLAAGSRPRATAISQHPPGNVVVLNSAEHGALDFCGALAAMGVGVVIADVPDDGAATEALAAGARGVVYASESPADILKAVRLVERGGVWAPRHVVVAAWTRLRSAEPPAAHPGAIDRLSSREREVFRHAARGLANKELASELAISEATVKAHLTHIFQKLGLRSRSELAAAYFGIVR